MEATVKRAVASVVGVLVLSLNQKLGLALDATAQASIAAIVVAYISQSAWKEAALAKVNATPPVTTLADAAAVLGGTK